jgi:hypothetical protein
LKNPGGSYYITDTEFKLDNMPVTDMLQHLLGATPASIEFIGDFPDERMNLSITYNRSHVSDINYLAFNSLSGLYNLSVSKNTQAREVYSISIANEKKLDEIKSKKSNVMTSISYEGDDWVGSNVEMPMLINFLESEMGVIFKDNTKLNKSLNIRFNRKNIESAIKSLEDSGFKVSKKNEDVSITIVERQSK